MIKRITTRAEVASILGLPDSRLTEQIPCEKAEWVQWLEGQIEKPEFLRIWGTVEDDKVTNYMVALNAVMPPISRSVLILYQSFYSETEGALEALAEVEKWAKELGATNLAIQTKYPRVNSQFGFVEEGYSMVMKI